MSTNADLNFPGSQLLAGWEIQGLFHPVGPVVQVPVRPEYEVSDSVPINGPEYHEFLHFSQVTSSTSGLFEAALGRLVLGNHMELLRTGHDLSLIQPHIRQISSLARDSPAFALFDGLLSIHRLRASLNGYPIEADQADGFLGRGTHIAGAADSFRDAYRALFGAARADAWRDLDGRHGSSATTPAAAPYPSGFTFGARSVFETFACAGQAASGGKTLASVLTPEGLAAEQRLMESRDLAVLRGAFERLATAWIAPVTDLGENHPWYARATDAMAAWYRAGAVFLFQEVSRDDLREAPLLETMLAFAELSINPAIFTDHLTLWTRRPSWVDIHPGYRYTDLCHCLYRLGFAPEMNLADLPAWHESLWEYLDEVSAYMEWPRHSEVVEANAGDRSLEDVVGAHQQRAYHQLNRQKLENLPSVLFATVHKRPPPSPAAIIEHRSTGEPEMRVLDDSDGIRRALTTTILEEFYFGEDFEISRSLLEGFPQESRRDTAGALEELLGIRGLGAAL